MIDNIFLKIAAFVAALLCFAYVAWGEPVQGYDILGLAMQDTQMIERAIKKDSAIGVLQGTFGNAVPSLEQIINFTNIKAYRAHLINGTCWRNHNCENGEPATNDFKTLQLRAQQFEALHFRHPNVDCYISPVLEHDEKNQAIVKRWFQIIKTEAPSCHAVCSYVSGWCPPGVLIERHGNQAHGDIVSNDGASLYDSNSANYWSHGRVLSLGWINRFNLRLSSEKTWTPPSKRVARATRDDILQINALMEPQPPRPGKPSFCGNYILINAPEVLKSNAEDYGKGEPRDNKPVTLFKKKYTHFDIYSLSGHQVACASNNHGLPPLNKLNRTYVGECSNHSNAELKEIAGSEWVIYKAGNDCYLGNAVRRLGTYR